MLIQLLTQRPEAIGTILQRTPVWIWGLLAALLALGDIRFEAASQTFVVPGSVVPLLQILGIFMTKYMVGIELAMNPTLAQDTSFVLPIALLYGAFNGIFTAQALRLLRMVGTHTPVTADGKRSFATRLLVQRDPW